MKSSANTRKSPLVAYLPEGGEWSDEKDLYKFRDPVSGYRCIVIRMKNAGNLNGYVELPHGSKFAKQLRKPNVFRWRGGILGRKEMFKQPLYERIARQGNIRVHGGLTFGGRLKSRFSERVVVGFDTAHHGDLTPGYSWTDGIYRNAEYVKSECLKLAQQLYKLHNK